MSNVRRLRKRVYSRHQSDPPSSRHARFESRVALVMCEIRPIPIGVLFAVALLFRRVPEDDEEEEDDDEKKHEDARMMKTRNRMMKTRGKAIQNKIDKDGAFRVAFEEFLVALQGLRLFQDAKETLLIAACCHGNQMYKGPWNSSQVS